MSGTKTAELYRMVMEDHLCPYGLKIETFIRDPRVPGRRSSP